MELSGDNLYQAALARDPRFDGVFYVAVATTRIYCRPVCTVRPPRRSSCTFYPSAAAAERAGFRPCLRCRPELAPGSAPVDAVGRLAVTAAGRIEEGALAGRGVQALAAELGVSDRHLRRAMAAHFGVSPVAFAQTQRLLLAKRLLAETRLPITDVAFASGFSSLRRFNALFRARYRLSPSAVRRGSGVVAEEGLVFELAYRPPLDWEALFAFLARRASKGVEVVAGGRYARTFAWGDRAGWLVVSPSRSGAARPRPVLQVELSPSLAPAVAVVLERVRRAFDLGADPQRIAEGLGELAVAHPGLRVPGAFDGFEVAVRAVLGQQVSVKAASTLAGRFAAAFGAAVETSIPGLDRLTPAPERVARASEEDLCHLGVTTARARSILALARAVEDGALALEPCTDPAPVMARLTALPGIGPWTAEYVAMRALGWPDAFPASDLGVLKALGETRPRRALERARAWRPWRSYAAMHLWRSLEAAP